MLEKAKKDLRALCQECGSTNWDGYDALPVKYPTHRRARLLLEAIPEELLEGCTFGADPDGSINVEWYAGKSDSISVCVQAEAENLIATIQEGEVVWTIIKIFDETILSEIKKVFHKMK